jgi:FMN reductase
MAPIAMVDVLAITASPSRTSRSQALAERALALAAEAHLRIGLISVRELPAVELVAGDTTAPAIAAAVRQIGEARAIVVITPIYKAAYTGLLKLFLDLLPAGAFAHKAVLPIALAASAGHALALEHALKPVLASLSPRLILPGLFALDGDVEANERFVAAVSELVAWLAPKGT